MMWYMADERDESSGIKCPCAFRINRTMVPMIDKSEQ